MAYNGWRSRGKIYYGKRPAGFDPTAEKLPGSGKIHNPLFKEIEFQSAHVSDSDDVRELKNLGDKAKKWSRQYGKNDWAQYNPWGDGPDATAAKMSWEKQFLANDKTARQEYDDLMRRKYGYSYQVEGMERANPMYEIRGDREDVSATLPVYEVVKGGKLNQIEEYKLWRYENRYLATEDRIGSGYDENYNPLGLANIDKTGVQEGYQQEGGGDAFKGYRQADRSAKKKGKANLTKPTADRKPSAGGIQL